MSSWPAQSPAIDLNFSGANGLGSLTLSGSANPYSGHTSIASGTLIAGNNAFLGYQSVFGNASSAITVGNERRGYRRPWSRAVR